MTRYVLGPVLALFVLTGVFSCSSSGSSKPPVCSSIDSLKSSVNQLKNTNVSSTGLSEVKNELAAIRTDLQHVARDAKSQYSAQVNTVKSSLSALQSAIATAKNSPSANTITQAGKAMSTLAGDVSKLVSDVSSTC